LESDHDDRLDRGEGPADRKNGNGLSRLDSQIREEWQYFKGGGGE